VGLSGGSWFSFLAHRNFLHILLSTLLGSCLAMFAPWQRDCSVLNDIDASWLPQSVRIGTQSLINRRKHFRPKKIVVPYQIKSRPLRKMQHWEAGAIASIH
jgi:hypothetical protein